MPIIGKDTVHLPVMLNEVIAILDAGMDGVYVDATLGLAGHALKILETAETSVVVGIDQDPEALKLASERLSQFGDRARFFQSNFLQIKQIVAEANVGQPNGIVADLGVSSLQLDSSSRGFSFRFDAPLDMRMDPGSGGESAASLLARISETDLANVIYEFGEERASRKIARWIIEKREAGNPITTTFGLAELVKRAVKVSPKDKTHPATRTFQALRIAVNRELEILDRFLEDSVDLLKTNGVLAVITFHSLEDRIVKRAFQRLAGKCQCPPRIPQCVCGAMKRVEILTRKPILPSKDEQISNPRSRSAKLRAVRKLDS